MQDYSPTQLCSRHSVDGPGNLLMIRADLHRVFDERHFCLVPKVGEKSGGDVSEAASGRDGATAERKPPQLVVHVFNSTASGQLPNLWHNRATHPIPETVTVERSAPMSANDAEDLLGEVSLSLYGSGYFGTDASVRYDPYLDVLDPAERQKEEPRGRSRKRRLGCEEEQNCKDFGQSRLRRKMELSFTS
ncbi:hypothetical protein PpBr36_07859 [Pyricularia pennisetigena]|uniref:hypothetical protein n=1 Tax=Pyricularia pennisetigena TaxID=1578925 RepID=UPI00115195A1|nr:hypothetical protein PpBr36_07859 [Pyricularia pennisetigena]TLS25537.1 hypothetical protein PpBr36_07859 [Pyricularia pennisetigena]